VIQLAVDLSDPLLELVRGGQVRIDAVEVGPWFSMQQIRAYRQALPGMPFHFHGADLIERVVLIPGAISRIAAYVHYTESPWASMHITMWLPGMVWLMLRHGWRMPLPNPERATHRFVRQVMRLSRSIPVPVTLENIEPLPFDGYDFEVQPARIAQVLERTGCGLVLDTGHARVSAAVLRMDVHEYLQSLPLAQVVQIHVSGPRERDGRLKDVHEQLQEIDYTLLEFVLARTRPQVVTLEYIREQDSLREQLVRLRDVVGSPTRHSYEWPLNSDSRGSSNEKSTSISLTRGEIEDGLRRLGLRRGDAVEVHSSLSSFGWVEGAAATVVDALMHVVGEEGTIVMSAYPLSLPLPLTEEERARGILAKVRILREDAGGGVYPPQRTGMGAIADEFRRRPGTVLGTGIHRVCAWGRHAALHSKGYEYLIEADGWVLLLGVDIHRCSSMHIAEGRAGIPDAITRRFAVPEDVQRDYPEDTWYVAYGSTPDDAWQKVQDEAEGRGLVQRRRIGRAECMLFKARAVVGIYEEFLRADPYGLFGVGKET
jgi:aminoglycoside N3'-acetyltransferase/uncharacterized protein (UPF0276 family)